MFLEFTDSIIEEKVSVLKSNIVLVEPSNSGDGTNIFLHGPILNGWRGKKVYVLFASETYEEIMAKLSK